MDPHALLLSSSNESVKDVNLDPMANLTYVGCQVRCEAEEGATGGGCILCGSGWIVQTELVEDVDMVGDGDRRGRVKFSKGGQSGTLERGDGFECVGVVCGFGRDGESGVGWRGVFFVGSGTGNECLECGVSDFDTEFISLASNAFPAEVRGMAFDLRPCGVFHCRREYSQPSDHIRVEVKEDANNIGGAGLIVSSDAPSVQSI